MKNISARGFRGGPRDLFGPTSERLDLLVPLPKILPDAISAPATTQGPVIGLNIGNSYASIAVVHHEGHAECIANEDGERQIALIISYNGEEQYIGNGAKPQLVKNSANTITDFRNVLGKKLNDLKTPPAWNSAPRLDVNGEVGYSVKVLVPAPKSVAKTPASAKSTPAPTRPSSPPPPAEVTKTLTASEAMTLFLSTMKTSAEDFLGKPISGAVIGVSDSFDDAQRAALAQAAEAAGIHVLQFASEQALAVLGAHDSSAGKALLGLESTTSHNASDATAAHAKAAEAHPDRTTLVVDVGSSSTSFDILSIKDHTLVHSLLPNGALESLEVGGHAIDNLLVGHFLKEFTKKTKVTVSFPPTTPADERAVTKLRIAVEDTKKSLQASTGAAACSVESLKDGFDFSGTINRLRFDVLLAPLYATIIGEIETALKSAALSKEQIDEVLLVGASSGLSGLSEKLEIFFGEQSPVAIRSDLDGSQLIAKGAALQAKLLSELDAANAPAFGVEAKTIASASVTSKSIGLVFPGTSEDKTIPVIVVASETPLPARRTLRLPTASGASRVAFEVWEGNSILRDLPLPPKPVYSDDEGEDEEEEEQVPEKEAVVEKETCLGGLALDVAKEKSIEVQVDVSLAGEVVVKARSAGSESWTVLGK
ncbi:actin-like ATPase domain-containing protein [Clavulina sp. PMI_390]|nr:actin-like ATPase domain-containing protein [Clavulina sp. PMI_390]